MYRIQKKAVEGRKGALIHTYEPAVPEVGFLTPNDA